MCAQRFIFGAKGASIGVEVEVFFYQCACFTVPNWFRPPCNRFQ